MTEIYNITFTNSTARTIYANMCEGMWEVARDNSVCDRDDIARMESLERILDALPLDGLRGTIEARDEPLARAVLENCLDCGSGQEDEPYEEDDDGRELRPGEVEIAPAAASPLTGPVT